ncbi:MAG: hypothetical protein M9945_14445 [Aquamicrobium sp.]|uniref:hypothetical protein n=1 Tax=Aquamicrobium sp. TaxID=1872579 RepID=UPI00349E72F9|nr:hypothetical protein [Aquamicrobium sp.]
MTAYVRAQQSCTLTEDEAQQISKRTHLFGYRPEIVRLPTGTRLTMFSDADAAKVKELRDEIRGAR